MAVASDTFGIRDTDPCGDSRAPLWRVDSRAGWLVGSRDVAEAYARLLNAENSRYEAVPYGKCHTEGCTRDASYDSEPGSESYFSNCERCSSYVGYRSHVHAHGYWPEYITAHPGTRTDAYMRTAEIMHPVITDDHVSGYKCGDYMCGHTESQPRYSAVISRWFGGIKTWAIRDHYAARLEYVSFDAEPFHTESEASARFMADALNG